MNLLDLAQQANLNPKWSASTQGGEHKSACPVCGGTDRFIIQPERSQTNCTGYYFCRRCEISGDSIQFCIDYLDYSFKEATELLGVTIENKTTSSLFKKSFKQQLPSLKSSPPVWHEQAAKVLNQAHKNLLQNEHVLTSLTSRGLTLESIVQYQFGWLDQNQYLIRTDWGLPEEYKEDGSLKKLWLPKGLVIPIIESDKVIRLKIRRSDWHPNDTLPKYVAVSGSMQGLSIIGNKKHMILIATESELDSFALHSAVGDFAVMIAVGGCTKNPDSVTDYFAKKKTLLVCPDADSAGNDMWTKWKSLYPHAINCQITVGKDIGEAIEQGIDIRSWIISKIPEQLQYELKLIHYPWDEQDQPLIDWTLNYIAPRIATSNFYAKLKDEIELGSKSPQAQTKELQNKLLLLKELAETEYNRRGEL
ncbi:MAG: primase-helicase zinc-binding domain-containing protein [Candidatus Babeliales bacterium]